MNLREVVALVTGGASGLGEATVLALAGAGAKVMIVDADAAGGERVAAQNTDSIMFAKADVADENDIAAAIKKTVDAFGKVNAVVNCAGAVSYTHLRAHETVLELVCRLLLEKNKNNKQHKE